VHWRGLIVTPPFEVTVPVSNSLPSARHMEAATARHVRTAADFGEMAVAAGRTVGARTALMASAGIDPVAWANPEFQLMGREKWEAGMAARAGMAAGETAAMEAATAWWSAHAAATSRLLGAVVMARSPAAAADALTGWATQAGDINLRTAFAVAEAVGRVVAGGLAPVHRTTMANAKRLG
jgi:hypothetical protein